MQGTSELLQYKTLAYKVLDSLCLNVSVWFKIGLECWWHF